MVRHDIVVLTNFHSHAPQDPFIVTPLCYHDSEPSQPEGTTAAVASADIVLPWPRLGDPADRPVAGGSAMVSMQTAGLMALSLVRAAGIRQGLQHTVPPTGPATGHRTLPRLFCSRRSTRRRPEGAEDHPEPAPRLLRAAPAPRGPAPGPWYRGCRGRPIAPARARRHAPAVQRRRRLTQMPARHPKVVPGPVQLAVELQSALREAPRRPQVRQPQVHQTELLEGRGAVDETSGVLAIQTGDAGPATRRGPTLLSASETPKPGVSPRTPGTADASPPSRRGTTGRRSDSDLRPLRKSRPRR